MTFPVIRKISRLSHANKVAKTKNMNFKNVSPKEFLELGLPKTAFRILGEVCWKRPRDEVGICTGGNDCYCSTNVKRD